MAAGGDTFRVARIRGRQFLITPQGHPFVSIGVNHIGAYPFGDALGLFDKKYGGDWRRLSHKSAADLLSWGFNTAGYHSPAEIRQLMPFMADSYPADIAYWMPEPDYPDVFDPAYSVEVERRIQKMCASASNNPNLTGYYWTDTPRWDIGAARRLTGKNWVSTIRAQRADTPGKRRYVAFIRETHQPNPEEFRAAYGCEIDQTDALLARDFADLDLSHPTVEKDDWQFLRLIAREYYQVAGTTTRREDPNHLILGDRYLDGDHPIEAVEEALPWIDVLSFQPVRLEFERERFDLLHRMSGKPILICDHQSSFYTEAYPRTMWEQSPSEREAAQAYDSYLSRAFERPYVIGYQRCQYVDRFEPSLGVLKQGLLREDETPYKLLVNQVRRTNMKIVARLGEEIGRPLWSPPALP